MKIWLSFNALTSLLSLARDLMVAFYYRTHSSSEASSALGFASQCSHWSTKSVGLDSAGPDRRTGVRNAGKGRHRFLVVIDGGRCLLDSNVRTPICRGGACISSDTRRRSIPSTRAPLKITH